MNYSIDWDGTGERDRDTCQCPRCGRCHWHLGNPPGLKARGVGRVADNEQAVMLYFDRKLTDDELRELHEVRILPADAGTED